MRREWQVEWVSRPDERDHIEVLLDFCEAHRLAKEMSDKHDTDAVVYAIDLDPEDDESCVSGFMEYHWGEPNQRSGSLANTDWPKL